jgi:opacity protein-like surface antigen
LLLSDNIHNSTSTVSDVKENYQKATVGYQAGVGIDLGKTVIIDLKYEGNLGKFANSVNIGNQTFNTDLRSSQWILSMGFNLL